MNKFEPVYLTPTLHIYEMNQGDRNFRLRNSYNQSGELRTSDLQLSEDNVFISSKTTGFHQGKPVSICHEYPNGLQVTKFKKNGKWQVNSIGFPSQNIDLYERKARVVGRRKTHGLVLDEYAIKRIENLPTTLKKVIQPSLERLIDMATKAIKR